ncbi:MAG: CocE/NonD family hydrolase [Chloroflexi bacterium]|nr:CocE/NonD family hydrolase [Chloroflexota bacterium]
MHVEVLHNVEARMRDGVVLRSDVYLPEGGGKHHVLICRTPYDKTNISQLYDAKRIARRGYAVVIQDVRGAFASDGEYYPFLTCREDGYDTVEWAAAQPWSNGRVGMFGGSAMGITQWLAAVEAPPHLFAIAPAVTASDLHDGWIYQSGALLLGFALSWAINLSRRWLETHKSELPPEKYAAWDKALADATANGSAHYLHLPLTNQPLLRDLARYYYEWLAHPSEDAYWKRWKIQDLHDRVKVPVFNLGGWYDIFIGGTMRNYAGMRERGGAAQSRSGTRLVVGPWFHGQGPTTLPEGWIDVVHGASQQDVDMNGQWLRWMDHWLKGEANGVDRDAPVRVYTLGEKRWQDFPSWPPPNVDYQAWHFHSGGRANTASGDGRLDRMAPEQEPRDDYIYDPADPAPTAGGGLCCQPMMSFGGAYDQRPIEARNDVLVYTSAPLERDLEVTGPVVVKLWASTSAVDTDFTAKLVDVHPDGLAQNLCDNIARARYHKSPAKPVRLRSNRVYPYTIDLYATSNLFKAGHRIRVEISSSNFPRFDRNLNTGGVNATESVGVRAQQHVYHDRLRPSHIILPVIPRSS